MATAERTARHTPGPMIVSSRLVRFTPEGGSDQVTFVWPVVRQEDGVEVGIAHKSSDAILWANAPELVEALQSARVTLANAIRAGLDGFSDDEVAGIIKEHVTIKRIDAVLERVRGGASE